MLSNKELIFAITLSEIFIAMSYKGFVIDAIGIDIEVICSVISMIEFYSEAYVRMIQYSGITTFLRNLLKNVEIRFKIMG